MDRVERFVRETGSKQLPQKSVLKLEKIIKDYKSGFNLTSPAFHVSVARVIELFNLLKKHEESVSVQDLQLLHQYLYPFAPMFAEDLWFQFSRSQEHSDYQPISKQIFIESDIESESSSGYALLLNSKKVEDFNLVEAEISSINPNLLSKDIIKLDTTNFQGEIRGFLKIFSKNGQLPSDIKIKSIIINNKKRLVNILYNQI